jgi:diaminohydroxyphosphoribosylaminopyrimidine deaminase / 5-amino-6-(5-phosphoribosylamino)uracil reductase
MATHEQYMQSALELAATGLGAVEPNPLVGCFIVKDNRIIGKGFHECFGGPHAEINALADCRQKGLNPEGSTVYVNLEPCCHVGKTGPCTEALIEAKVACVVAAAQDPTDNVAGKGFDRLRQAGIEVVVGVCQSQALQLNAPFYKHARTGLPWVIAKWAQSIDGRLSWQNPPSQGQGHWISNEKSRLDAHVLRKRTQAILIGVNSVISDNPRLTIRIPGYTVQRPPLRAVLDTHLRMPWESHLITIPEAPTLIVTGRHTVQTETEKVASLFSAGVDVLAVTETDGRCDLVSVLMELGKRGVQQVLVEGGPTVLSAFFKEHLVNEVCVYIAPLILGAGGIADLSAGLAGGVTAKHLVDVKIQTFDKDIKITGILSQSPG